MSDILDVIKTRRSVRKYKSDMVPAEIIDKILKREHMRLQEWTDSRQLYLQLLTRN